MKKRNLTTYACHTMADFDKTPKGLSKRLTFDTLTSKEEVSADFGHRLRFCKDWDSCRVTI